MRDRSLMASVSIHSKRASFARSSRTVFSSSRTYPSDDLDSEELEEEEDDEEEGAEDETWKAFFFLLRRDFFGLSGFVSLSSFFPSPDD